MANSRTPADPAASSEQKKTERLFAWAFLVGGTGASIAGLFDSAGGLLSAWDNALIPITSSLYFAAGLAILLRPRWTTLMVLASMGFTMIYQQGVMFMAVHHPDAATYYSAASSGPYFPLLYVVIFIMLPRGATTFSLINWGGFVLQFALDQTWLAEQSFVPGRSEGEHLLVEAITAHPIYIVSLNYIVNLRERLHAVRQESFRHKEDFLAMMSHEIRNQLQTMVGAIELLDLRLKEPAERRAVARLQSSAAQLQTYLSDVGELTKLEDPALRIEETEVHLKLLLDDIREEWLPKAQERGLRLDLTGGEGLPAVRTDAARVRQIISNLVSNALKYTETGGVTISAHRVENEAVAIEVADTGIGIEKRFLEKIFLPHVRLDNAVARKAEGSGMGLAIVQRLAVSIGGSITVESRPGEGSSFVLTLPLHPQKPRLRA